MSDEENQAKAVKESPATGNAEMDNKDEKRTDLKPKEIVQRLDQYIIGQEKAKRAVAIVLRNRYRRLKLPEDIRAEVAPKNILMIGPTGVGKTEIARRLAKLVRAPFIKVEATKYTEVGYVGRDVESMVRDLMAVGYNDVKAEMEEMLREKSVPVVEEKLLDLLLPGTGKKHRRHDEDDDEDEDDKPRELPSIRSIFEALRDDDDDDDDKDSDDKESTDKDGKDGNNEGVGDKGAADKDNGSEDSRSKDVDAIKAIIRDAEASIAAESAAHKAENASDSSDAAAETVTTKDSECFDTPPTVEAAATQQPTNPTREKFRKMLRDGKLEEREVELVTHPQMQMPSMEIIAGGSLDELQGSMQSLMGMLSGRNVHRRTLTVREARKIISEEVLDSMVDTDKVAEEAKTRVEQSGIIFIDEIDKIATKSGESHGQDVSREGVQRDILPIVEGSSVNTRYGVVDTTHILFIAAGAFSVSSPSDLIPELQGRFPLRVELDALTKDDFRRILTEPRNALTKQYTALLATEDVKIDITDGAIERMASLAEEVNSRDENIGARRLHTIMEKVLDDISFSADEHAGETITIDENYVDDKLRDIVKDTDVSRYIL